MVVITERSTDSIVTYAVAPDGSLSLEDATAGIAVEGMPGLRDLDLSGDGRFLYVIDADGGWALFVTEERAAAGRIVGRS